MSKHYWKYGEPRILHDVEEAKKWFMDSFIKTVKEVETTEKIWHLFLDENEEWTCVAGSMYEEYSKTPNRQIVMQTTIK